MKSLKRMGIIHSLDKTDNPVREVTIMEYRNPNHVTVAYNGDLCMVVDNPFNGCLMVDDIYGLIGAEEEG